MTRNRAFTLTEVMFAVITLGIGLIMVAAVFPVAIQQTKLTSEEGVAASIAWSAMNQLSQSAQIYHAPSAWPATGPYGATNLTGAVVPLTNPAWLDVRGNVIVPTDPRYAWVAMYRRDGDAAVGGDVTKWADTAQVFLIPVAVRALTTFSAKDVDPGGTNQVNLAPRAVKVVIANGVPDGSTDTITFTAGANANDLNAIGVGTYVVISNDNISSPANDIGRMNGRIYRVGNPIDEANHVWELMPGNDFTPDGGANGVLGAAGSRGTDDICAIGTSNAEGSNVQFSGPADAYIVGKGLQTPGTASTTYADTPMDIAAYTGFITIKY
jgi:type II secretory pathway pseudopilin PulG